MYVLLSGALPFRGSKDHDTIKRVRKGQVKFPKERWGHVSKDAKSLILSLLTVDPQARLSADQAYRNEWVASQSPLVKKTAISADVAKSLRSFTSANNLKKAALSVVARELDHDTTEELRSIFQSIDTSNDGTVSVSELADALRKAGIDTSDLKDIFIGIDQDNSGMIDYTEFLAASMVSRYASLEAQCESAFRVFDQNDDGKISAEELRAVLKSQGNQLTDKGFKDIMKEVDLNQDGEIDFQEFMSMMSAMI
jgi:calcium-dependent protein kinase